MPARVKVPRVRRPWRRIGIVLAAAAATALCASAASLGYTPGVSNPEVLVSKMQLQRLGLTDGPDSVAARFTVSKGRTYLAFTAANGTAYSERLFRFPVSRAGKVILTAAGSRPRPVLLPSASGEPNPAPWCAGSACFDADYSGGGTLLRCPNGGPLLMSYHGENHTDPAGQRLARAGWSGIGLARWNASAKRFVKLDQIIGLHASNAWQETAQGWETDQAPPLSFEGDMVLNPKSRMVYLYYGDKLGGTDPYSGIRIAVAAVTLATLCRDAAAGVHVPWKKWYDGSFTQPGVYTSATNPENMPAGTGGKFTPLLNTGNETSPTVTYHGGKWYMVTATGHLRLSLRTSSDGLRWSGPTTLYVPNRGLVMYPYLWSTGVRGKLYLTFTWQQAIRPWRGDFALEQVRLNL